MSNKILTPPLMMSALATEAFQAALDIGSANWDSYLEPNRWPELEADERYKKFKEHISQFDVPLEEQLVAPDDALAHGVNPEKEPDAPAPDGLLDLASRCASIIRKQYFRYTRNERLSEETAVFVLEEVTRTYEQLAERADPHSLS